MGAVGSELVREFDVVVADPGARDAHAGAARLFDAISAVSRPSKQHAALMADHALVWAGLGFADPARGLLRRWRRAGRTSRALRRAEVVYNVTVSPSAAAAHLRGLGASDAQFAALNVVNSLYRGELAVAIAMSQAHNWFIDDDELAHGLFHGLWALGLSERFDEAHAILDDWKRRHPRASPVARQFVLRTEAGMASFQQRYLVEEALVDEALALCIEHDLGIARVYTEASAVAARARADNLDRALALMATWPRRRTLRGPIDAFRDVAALEVAMLSDRPRKARAAGMRALAFFERTEHAVMTCFVRMRLTLSADASEFSDQLDGLRRTVRRCPLLHYAQRVRAVEELAAAGHTCARQVRLVERSRHRRQEHGLARAWTPPVSAAEADLFWNRISGTLHVRGRGPFSLGRKPVLRRCLEALLMSDGFASPISRLFELVWGAPYNPIVHEGKVHVSIHRLRAWLDECIPGGKDMVRVVDGTIAIAESVDVRVLEPSGPAVVSEPARSIADRVMRVIESEAVPVAAGALQLRLGVSRPALNLALRALVASSRVRRIGDGRATRYEKP